MTDETLPVGAIITHNGVRLRHLGDGRFEPAGEPLEKRFTADDGDMTAGMVQVLNKAKQQRRL